jgi:glycolate oxidase FAD binding subunit
MTALGTERPANVAELCERVRQAVGEGRAVYPLGGGTMPDLGRPAQKQGITVELTRLDQVIDYPARDMTITVQAGITVGRLQEVLAKENQRLPVDVPLPELATLGGAIATNASGPRRYGFGTLRDYVIGINVVNDRGEEVKAGGRVVKNVAGYDLCKLHIGALGTLGIITQVTLKVRPRPEATALVQFGCTRLGELLDVLTSSATRPSALSVLSPAAAAGMLGEQVEMGASSWRVLVGFEDNYAAVEWQVEQLQRELAAIPLGDWRRWDDAEAEMRWMRVTDFQAAPTAPVIFKATLRPSAVAGFCESAERIAPALLAHAGDGSVFGHLPAETTAETVTQLRELAMRSERSLVLLRCPEALRTSSLIWGEARGDWELMRSVKRALDPKGVFNPGRFVGGI